MTRVSITGHKEDSGGGSDDDDEDDVVDASVAIIQKQSK